MADDQKIVPLRGDFVPAPGGSPDDEIVRHLEALLQEARTGNVRGVAFAVMSDAGRFRIWFKAEPAMGNALIGVVRRMEDRLLRTVEEE